MLYYLVCPSFVYGFSGTTGYEAEAAYRRYKLLQSFKGIINKKAMLKPETTAFKRLKHEWKSQFTLAVFTCSVHRGGMKLLGGWIFSPVLPQTLPLEAASLCLSFASLGICVFILESSYCCRDVDLVACTWLYVRTMDKSTIASWISTSCTT